jgi:hypothetical protein
MNGAQRTRRRPTVRGGNPRAFATCRGRKKQVAALPRFVMGMAAIVPPLERPQFILDAKCEIESAKPSAHAHRGLYVLDCPCA